MKHVEKLMDELVKLSVTELNHMAHYAKEKYGLEPTQVTTVQTTTEVTEETETVKYHALHVSTYGNKKLAIVKELNTLTSAGLTQAKAMVDSGEPLLKNRSMAEIEGAKKIFEEISDGFTCEIKSQENMWDE